MDYTLISNHIIWRVYFILTIYIQASQAGLGDIESSRLVVTFQTASDNTIEGKDLGGATVVKQYGRRLVLDIGYPFDLDFEESRFRTVFKSIQSVEIDYLIGLQQTDLSQIVAEDSLIVTKINSVDPDVDGAYISPASQTPLWNLMDSEPHSIHAEGVWQVTNSTPDMVVAIIDTGIAEPARGLFISLLDGYDFISDVGISIDGDGRDQDSTDPGDWGDSCPSPSWHGTKVASILAARHDNIFGMKGVAQNCSIMPIRVLGLCRMGYATDVADAIIWAAGGTIKNVPDTTDPANIISLSLAGEGDCPGYLQSVITHAISLGATIVVAAGNSNSNVSRYFPANCKGVISVAAGTRDGKLAIYSNWGQSISVSAPGGDYSNAIMALAINLQESGLELTYGIGTSFAVPHISGVGALIGTNALNNVIKLWKEFYPTEANESTSGNICKSEQCSANIISSIMINVSGVFAASTCPSFNSMGLCGVIGEFYSCGSCTCPSGYYYIGNYDGLRYYTEGCFSCTSCTAVQYLYGCNSMGPGYCTNCGPCSPGQYIAGCGGESPGTCSPCPSNCYCIGGSNSFVAWTITGCSAGNYLSTSPSSTTNGVCTQCTTLGDFCDGTSSKVRCPSGMYCTNTATKTSCAAGYYCPTGSTAPTACAAGKYSVTLSASLSSVCTSCLAGTYSATTGASLASVCLSCVAGKYSTVGSTFCTLCTAGKYSLNPKASLASNCTSCAVGKYSSTTGASLASVCITCASGKYSLIGSSNCTACGIGKYSTTIGAIQSLNCTLCVAGTYSSIAGASACTACEAGKYSTALGVSLNSTCKSCIVSTYCSSGSTAQLPCPAGYYCTNSSSKILCSQGGYCPINSTAVKLCLAGLQGGTAGASNSSNCIACLPGKFSSAAGATICSVCASGKYTTASNTVNCAQCSNTPICQNVPGYLQNCTATTDVLCIYCNDADKPLYSSWKRSSSVQYSCTWICDTGYFKMNSSTCQACKSPSSCTTSQYVTTCSTTVDGLCLGCNNKPLDSFYTGASPLYSVSACSWSCNSGYSLNQSSSKCDPQACQAGKYVVGSPPTCISCPSGTYSVNASSSSCSICSFNTYTPSIGASACTKCPRCAATGQYSIGCGGTSSGTCVKCTNTIN